MTSTAQATTPPSATHRRSTALTTLVIPIAASLGTVVVAHSWRGDLPSQVATHFSPDGPDGFSSLTRFLVLTVVVSVLLAVTMWVVASRLGRDSLTRRVAAGTAVGVATFLSGVALGTLAMQRGLGSAALIADIDPAIGVALAVGILAGALAAWATPGDSPRPTHDAVPADARRVSLGAQERAVWVQRTSTRLPWVVGACVLVPLVILAVILREPTLLVAPAVCVLPLVSILQFTVTVDDTGLAARSLLGAPRITVPLDEVVRAEEVTVSPLREFGGWGIRVGRGGRTGIVLRGGSALQVERTGGRILVVTIDDAAAGAALLNTLAARRR